MVVNVQHISRATRKQNFIGVILAIVICGIVSLGFSGEAKAAGMVDQSCNTLNTQGFTAGLVYCVQKTIGSAVTIFVKAMQNHLATYEYMALVVAVAMFGFKMMNSNVQYFGKESMGLAFRIIIGLFFYNAAPNIYNWIVGIPPNGGMINEAVGWVTGLTGGGSGSNVFGNLISTKCTAPTLTNNYAGSQVWQAFDCMFSKITGAANPATNPGAFGTSLLILIGAALFSATLGVTLALLGITVILWALLLVMRALFMVLMAYITIGFMAIFTPLIAPLLFFESRYLNERFMAWASIILSSIIQPVFVIGFLAMAVSIDDQLIEGQLPGCTMPTYPTSSSTISDAPAQGFGQNGTGVCSFTQLAYNNYDPKTQGDVLTPFFNSMLQFNKTMFGMSSDSDPQMHSRNNSTFTPTTGDSSNDAQPYFSFETGKTRVLSLPQQSAAMASSYTMTATGLRDWVPIRQLMMTMLAIIFTTYVLYQLMDVIPEMAKRMTISTGLSMYAAIKVPLEETMGKALQGANKYAKESTAGAGLASGNLQGIKRALQAIPRAAIGAGRSLRE